MNIYRRTEDRTGQFQTINGRMFPIVRMTCNWRLYFQQNNFRPRSVWSPQFSIGATAAAVGSGCLCSSCRDNNNPLPPIVSLDD